MDGTVLVIAKEPVPGRVKTRLVPPLTYDEAAELAAAAIADTLRAVDSIVARRLLILDGRPGAWLPPEWAVVPQSTGGLDARLVAAFAAVGTGPAILVGMDTPQLRADQVTAFDPVHFDACLGMARDGGYWVIGFRDPALAATTIDGVPMSRADTGAIQLARLQSAGLRVQLLDELTDVDTYADARAVAAAAPGTTFAATLRAIEARTPGRPLVTAS